MLDSGSSVSLVQHDVLHRAKDIWRIQPRQPLRLVTASGEHLPIMEHIQAPVKLGELELMHEFVVVESLVAPVILGVDFLQGNGLVLDFTQTPVMVQHATVEPTLPPSQTCAQVMPIYQDERRMQARACAITMNEAGHVLSQHLTSQGRIWLMIVQCQTTLNPQKDPQI